MDNCFRMKWNAKFWFDLFVTFCYKLELNIWIIKSWRRPLFLSLSVYRSRDFCSNDGCSNHSNWNVFWPNVFRTFVVRTKCRDIPLTHCQHHIMSGKLNNWFWSFFFFRLKISDEALFCLAFLHSRIFRTMFATMSIVYIGNANVHICCWPNLLKDSAPQSKN